MKKEIKYLIIVLLAVISTAWVGYWIGKRNAEKSEDQIKLEQELIKAKENEKGIEIKHKTIVDSLNIRAKSFENSYNTISKFKTKITYEIKSNSERIDQCSDSSILFLIDSIRAKGFSKI